MKDFFPKLKEDLEDYKPALLLIVEIAGLIFICLNWIKDLLPNNLKWVNHLLIIFLVYILIRTLCRIIIKKRIIVEEVYRNKYSANQIKAAKIVKFVSTILFCGYTVFFTSVKLFTKSANTDSAFIKIVLSSFYYNSISDEFSNSLRSNLNEELTKREVDSIRAIKIDDYYSVEKIKKDTLKELFIKNYARKGIFAFGDYWSNSNTLDCNLYIYELPLLIKISQSKRNDDFFNLKAPDTARITDVQGQTDYVTQIILAILYQRLSNFDQSNRLINKLLSMKTLRKSFITLCYRLEAENYAAMGEYKEAKLYFENAFALDSNNRYLKGIVELLNTKQIKQPEQITTKKKEFNSIQESITFPPKQTDTFKVPNSTLPTIHNEKEINSNLTFQIDESVIQLDTLLIELKKVPNGLRIQKNNKTLRSQMNCFNITGELNSRGIKLNIPITTSDCVRKLNLSLFSNIDSIAFAEISIPYPTHDNYLMLPWEKLFKSPYAKSVLASKINSFFVFGFIETTDKYAEEPRAVYSYIFRD